MTTDVELLMAAAKAAGIEADWHHGCGDALHLTAPDETAIYWNPLRSDADALAKTGLALTCLKHSLPGDASLFGQADIDAFVDGNLDVRR